MRRPTHARATWLFLRLLGLVYLAAFWSLSTQILGLVGHDGILPSPFSDRTLQALCVSGIGLSMLLVLGLAPVAMLAMLWLAYGALSYASGGFLSYQWDALLLEAGFLAVFLAPWVWRERTGELDDPPRLAVWLFLWLVFRLMFASGAAKLTSGDPTWRGLTALSFHFETQPIPTPVAWYVHLLPPLLLKIATGLSLAIELGAPCLLVAGRRARIAACVLLVGLQAIIALTGNYAFFNLLTIALCVFLLDDEALGRWGAIRIGQTVARRVRHALLIAVAAATVPLSMFMLAGSLGIRLPGAALVSPIAQVALPLHMVNRYGLFTVMTTTRPEIVVEGSEDGETWREYEFKYKAGDVGRRPPWVAPHQPRLDWQMWFAALGEPGSAPWFEVFCERLLDADASVLRLLARDPFEGRKPRLVRGVLYDYRFSDWATKQRTGAWWVRERIGNYSPILTAR